MSRLKNQPALLLLASALLAGPATAAPLETLGEQRSDATMQSLIDAGRDAGWQACVIQDGDSGRATIDPGRFLEVMLQRYRGLTTYIDSARLVTVRTAPGAEPVRVETRIECEVRDGERLIRTPGEQLRRGIVGRVALRRPPAMSEAQRRYDSWLAPHLALAEEPAGDGAPANGAIESMRPARAEAVTVDERALLHLELASPDADGDGDDDATLEIWVDPDSLLVERVAGRQRTPDGGDWRTELDITPVYADPAAPSETTEAPVEPIASPTMPVGATLPPG